MATPATIPRTELTFADLLDQFGPLPARRLRTNPPPGTATEEDVVEIHDRESRLCELVGGVLVEKTVGFYESYLAMFLAVRLGNFADVHKKGIVTGEGSMTRLAPNLVRIPDVSFISFDRLPGRRIPRQPIPDLVPDLAVEVLSAGNTWQEMDRKLHDYFTAGVRLVWYVDPAARAVTVYTAPDRFTRLSEGQILDGGDVLPGFTLPLQELFAEPDASRAPAAP